MPPKTRTFKNGKYDFKSEHKKESAAKTAAKKYRKDGWLAGIVKYKTKKSGTAWLVYVRKKAAKKAAAKPKSKPKKKGKGKKKK